MMEALIRKDVQEFIFAHEQDDEKKLVLKHRFILDVPSSVMAEQISGRRKAKTKLPLYYSTRNIVYPPGINLEQSSSQETSQFKATILRSITDGNVLADLTGGLGVDSFFMSQVFGRTEFIEPNQSLLQVAQHNHYVLGATTIGYHPISAEQFIQSYPAKLSVAYLDPSRRSKSNQKVFKLSDCEPNVPPLLSNLFQKTDCVLIKTSPLLDIQQGIKELQYVEKVWVVSVDNECKELLFLCRKELEGEPRIIAVNLEAEPTEFPFLVSEEKNAAVKFSEPLTFLYEPNASVLKAGAFKLISQRFSVFKVHPNTHLYTSDDLIQNFPGRIFKIRDRIKPNSKMAHELFPKGMANIITRNYPLSPEELKKKLNLKDGGEFYLIGFSAAEKYLVAVNRIK